MSRFFTIVTFLISLSAFSQSLQIKSDDVQIEFLTVAQKTSGTIGNLEATINFSPTNLKESNIAGSVDVNTLTTGNKMRNNHLKSDDFFDAENFPTITFVSSSINKEKDGYVMTGLLTIEDVTHAESIFFTFSDKTFVGVMTISMANYDLGMFSKKKRDKSNVTIRFTIPTQ